MGSSCLMGTEFQFGMIKKFWLSGRRVGREGGRHTRSARPRGQSPGPRPPRRPPPAEPRPPRLHRGSRWSGVRPGPRDRRAQSSFVLARVGAARFRRLRGASWGWGWGRGGLLSSPHFPGSEASRTRLGSSSLMGSLPAGN